MEKPTHYFLEVEHGTASKNNLQLTIYERLKEEDRHTIDEICLEGLKRLVLNIVAHSNLNFPRCKPIKATWSPTLGELSNDWHLSLNGETFMYVKIKALWSY